MHPVRRCIQAALEQDAEVELLVLPEGNRRAVEGDAALQEDIKDAKAKLRYVATVRDLFTGDHLFCEPLYAPPLRRSRVMTDSRAAALQSWNPFGA